MVCEELVQYGILHNGEEWKLGLIYALLHLFHKIYLY